MQLKDYLNSLAEMWTQASGRTLGALSTRVVNDGKFFGRLAVGTGPSVTAFEKFLAFFRNGDNWPDNRIPQAAVDLLDRLDAIATEGRASTDNAAENIGVAASFDRCPDGPPSAPRSQANAAPVGLSRSQANAA